MAFFFGDKIVGVGAAAEEFELTASLRSVVEVPESEIVGGLCSMTQNAGTILLVCLTTVVLGYNYLKNRFFSKNLVGFRNYFEFSN